MLWRGQNRVFQCRKNPPRWQAFPIARVTRMLIDKQLDLIYPLQLTDERKMNFIPTSYAWKTQIYLLLSTKVDLTWMQVRGNALTTYLARWCAKSRSGISTLRQRRSSRSCEIKCCRLWRALPKAYDENSSKR